MGQSSPLWKQLFDRTERAIGPALDGLVRTEEFAALTALSQRGFIEIDRRLETASRRLWHRLNLPAGSDINRLLEHIARLERHVSELEHQLKDRENAEYLASLSARHESRMAAEQPPEPSKPNASRPARRTTPRAKKRGSSTPAARNSDAATRSSR